MTVTATDYLTARLTVLKRQRRTMYGPITSAYHRLDGAIAELEAALVATEVLP